MIVIRGQNLMVSSIAPDGLHSATIAVPIELIIKIMNELSCDQNNLRVT